MIGKVLIILGGIFLFCSCTYLQEQDKKDADDLIKKLQSEERKDRETAKRLILEQREKLIQKLIEIVKSHSEPDFIHTYTYRYTAKNIAIHILGEMRSIEAIDVLIPLIVVIEGKPMAGGLDSRISLEKHPPAAEALVKIGVPAVPKLLKNLSETKSEQVIKNTSRILYKIYGYDVAKFVLEKEIKSEKDEKKIANLKKALEELEKIKTNQEK